MSDSKWSQAVNINGIALDLVGSTFTIPSGTDTTIGESEDDINTSDYKVAGSLIYNSTTGGILVAIGDTAISPWHTAAGVESIVPST